MRNGPRKHVPDSNINNSSSPGCMSDDGMGNPITFTGHEGCFSNDPVNGLRLDPYEQLVADGGYDGILWQTPPHAMTVPLCTEYCAQRGMDYAALRAGFLCYCLQAQNVCAASSVWRTSVCKASDIGWPM